MYLKGYHVKKPNIVLDQKEDISNKSGNISSWNGLPCGLEREIFQGRHSCGAGLERSSRGIVHVELGLRDLPGSFIVHVELRFTDQSFKLKTTTKQITQPKQQNPFA